MINSPDLCRFAAAAPHDLADITALAHATWPAAYGDILAPEQISWMLAEQYNAEQLQADMAAGIAFVYALLDTRRIGFFAYGPTDNPHEALLHKIYLLPEFQSQGIGSAMLQEARRRCRCAGFTSLCLYVNQHNQRAIRAYQRNGFQIARSEVFEIGQGFVREDYLMCASLTVTCGSSV